MLLYDKERKAITVEVEISKVEETHDEADYPFTNWFAGGSIRVLEPPISAENIESMTGFEKFTHERAPYRNLTHEQYRSLGLAPNNAAAPDRENCRRSYRPSGSSPSG